MSGPRAGTPRLRLVAGAVAGPACSLGGVVAALASFRPWTRATLADRGADLLVVTQSGWDLAPAGQLVFALGVAVALVVLVPRADASRWLRPAVPAAGLAMLIVPLTALGTGEPVARKLERLRIGTFQTENPVATHGTTLGLWITLAAGIVILLAGGARLASERKARRVGPPRPAYDGSADHSDPDTS